MKSPSQLYLNNLASKGFLYSEPTVEFKFGLTGGLRSKTSVHHVGYDIVVKHANFSELARQKEYYDNLPPTQKALFVPFISVERDDASELGFAYLPYFPGRSLHQLLISHESIAFKREILLKVLHQLRILHKPGYGEQHLSAIEWIKGIEDRLPRSTHCRMQDLLHQLVLQSANGANDRVISAAIIHGDPQAGNILISPYNDVRFIDPLGGSGTSPGDPIYDYSRLYHWVDAAGSCSENLVIRRRQDKTLCIHQKLSGAIVSYFRKSRPSKADRFWFYLYAAFHLSGKFANFKHPTAVAYMDLKLERYLRAALQLSKSKAVCF